MISRNVFISIDVGTTQIRACIFDSSKCELLFQENRKLHYAVDRLEIDPDVLWEQFHSLVMYAGQFSGFEELSYCLSDSVGQLTSPSNVIALCLSCQRNSFTSWDR